MVEFEALKHGFNWDLSKRSRTLSADLKIFFAIRFQIAIAKNMISWYIEGFLFNMVSCYVRQKG